MASRTLSHAEARRFYDRLGAGQDRQHFYEGPALAELCEHARFEQAHAVVEFGCGTGRFAAELLAERLPADARYLGLDQSETMVALAGERAARFGERAQIRHTNGAPRVPAPDRSFDRFVSTYVLDLLCEADIRRVLDEAWRVLADDGLLGLVGLTPGTTALSRIVAGVWSGIHRLHPALVGGCRPLQAGAFLAPTHWRVEHRRVVTPFGLPSEIVLAAPHR